MLKDKVIALIPARLHSTRLPKKLLRKIGDQSIVSMTYQAVSAAQIFSYVAVVTDSDEIEAEIRAIGGNVIRSSKDHQSGSDRIAEASLELDCDIIVNVQADEPFIDKFLLWELVRESILSKADVVTAAFPITAEEDIENPNNVKVYFDSKGVAENFSRTPLYSIDQYQHIGVYAFRKQALQRFTQLPQSSRELEAKLENLRFLDNEMVVKVLTVNEKSIGIDTEEDLQKAIKLYENIQVIQRSNQFE